MHAKQQLFLRPVSRLLHVWIVFKYNLISNMTKTWNLILNRMFPCEVVSIPFGRGTSSSLRSDHFATPKDTSYENWSKVAKCPYILRSLELPTYYHRILKYFWEGCVWMRTKYVPSPAVCILRFGGGLSHPSAPKAPPNPFSLPNRHVYNRVPSQRPTRE